jgi:hypothetical protein
MGTMSEVLAYKRIKDLLNPNYTDVYLLFPNLFKDEIANNE